MMAPQSGRFALRFPEHLPLIGGLAGAALIAGAGVLQTAALVTFGRPSSTTAIGFVIAPIVGVIAGIAIFATAAILLALLRRAGVKPASRPMPAWFPLLITAGVVIALAALFAQARHDAIALEAERRPQVIRSSPLLAAMPEAPASLDARATATVQYDLTAPGEAGELLTWNGRPITIDAAQEQILVKDGAGKTIASTDLHAFDYILNVRALPVCAQADGTRLLAVLVMLRATSNRSMLLVYDARGALIYQEHLERSGMNNDLAAGQVNGREVMVVHTNAPRAWTCAALPGAGETR